MCTFGWTIYLPQKLKTTYLFWKFFFILHKNFKFQNILILAFEENIMLSLNCTLFTYFCPLCKRVIANAIVLFVPDHIFNCLFYCPSSCQNYKKAWNNFLFIDLSMQFFPQISNLGHDNITLTPRNWGKIKITNSLQSK